MKNFLIMYGMPTNAMATMQAEWSEEQMKQGQQDWVKWMNDNKAQMTDMGNPVGKNTRLTADGATEASNEIAGYSIFQGESKEAVVELLKSNPHFAVPGGYIEVMEIMPMMG